MSTFSYETYTATVAAAQNKSKTQGQRIGFFKLEPDAEALVRFNIKSVEDLHFATVHKPVFGKKYEGLTNQFAGISCHNEVGSYSDACPFCKAVAEGHQVIGKAEKKVFITMLVSYKDSSSGTWSEAVPVVWERPAGYAREIATKLQNYGDLTQSLFKLTRVGTGKETKYILDYAVPAIFKADMVPVDKLSAFAGFKVNKHSYWEKPIEDCLAYVRDGAFPETVKVDDDSIVNYTAAPVSNTTVPEVTITSTSASAPVEEKPATTGNFGSSFNGFSF